MVESTEVCIQNNVDIFCVTNGGEKNTHMKSSFFMFASNTHDKHAIQYRVKIKAVHIPLEYPPHSMGSGKKWMQNILGIWCLYHIVSFALISSNVNKTRLYC